LVYLALMGLMVGFFWLLTPLLVDQVTTIVGRLPDFYRSLVNFMTTSRSVLLQNLALQLPPGLTASGSTLLPAPTATTPDAPPLDAVGQVFNYLSGGARWLFIGTSILVLAYYWTLDGQRTLRSLLLRLPVDRRELAWDMINTMENRVGAYVRGVVILSIAVAVMAGAAYLVIGLPYALVLALVAGVLEVLPVIGPVLALIFGEWSSYRLR
jgi:predicted PurR-regulated permease PerM